MLTDTLVLATSAIAQPACSGMPSRTLLVAAATLTVRERFGAFGFDLQAHSTTVTDDPAATMNWLTERLALHTGRTLVWRAENIVVPSLIQAADTARDALAATRVLREFQRTFTREVIDVADRHGGTQATSFDAIAHKHGIALVPSSREKLVEAHRIGNHGDLADFVAARAKAMWSLWLLDQPGADDLTAATNAWLASPDAEVRP